jgi:membrane protease YdiL (CAAX protease family)
MLLVILLSASLNGTRGKHPFGSHGKLPIYLWSMSWEWLLVGFTWLGVRKRRTLRDLIGGRWSSLEDFLFDAMIAAGFWLFAALVLGGTAKLMHLDHGSKLDDMRRSLEFLVPQSRLEFAVWFCVSVSAGFCEEVLFRGYLQQQFGALAGSTLAGVLLSAVVFGASHGYEGAARMFLIGIFGLLFGLLAWWRKSLSPGIIAHAWHDALSGTILRMVK